MKKDNGHIIYDIDVKYGTTFSPDYMYNIIKAEPIKVSFKQKFWRLFDELLFVLLGAGAVFCFIWSLARSIK